MPAIADALPEVVALSLHPQLANFSGIFELGGIGDSQLASIGSSFAQYGQGLQGIHLDFRLNDKEDFDVFIGADGASELGKQLGSLTELQHLDVSFKQCPQVNGAGFAGFSSGLQSLTELRSLVLNLDYAFEDLDDKQACNDAGKQLAAAISLMKNLQELSLRTEDFDDCVDVDGVAALAEAIACLESTTVVRDWPDGTNGLQDTGLLYDHEERCVKADYFRDVLGEGCLVCNKTMTVELGALVV